MRFCDLLTAEHLDNALRRAQPYTVLPTEKIRMSRFFRDNLSKQSVINNGCLNMILHNKGKPLKFLASDGRRKLKALPGYRSQATGHYYITTQ